MQIHFMNASVADGDTRSAEMLCVIAKRRSTSSLQARKKRLKETHNTSYQNNRRGDEA